MHVEQMSFRDHFYNCHPNDFYRNLQTVFVGSFIIIGRRSLKFGYLRKINNLEKKSSANFLYLTIAAPSFLNFVSIRNLNFEFEGRAFYRCSPAAFGAVTPLF